MKPEEQARLAQDLRELGIRGLADFLANLARIKKAYQATPKTGVGLPGGFGVEDLQPNPILADYLMDMAKLGTSYYRSVLDLNAAYWSKLSSTAPRARTSQSEGRRMRLDAEVSPSDDRASFDVEIVNRSHEDGRLSFLVSDLRTREGDSVRPAVEITPPRPRVVANGTARVNIHVPVRGVLEPGKKYRGRIAVRGPEVVDIILRVRVRGA